MVVAAEGDVLEYRASVSQLYDSNLFRQSQREVSDQATIANVGVRLNKAYAMQRWIADVNYVDYRYQNNDFLNYAALNYDASWLWSLTPQLTGVLSTNRTQQQLNFRDLQSTQRNVVTNSEQVFRAEYSPHQVVSLIMGYSEFISENSQTFNAIASNQRLGLDMGIKYRFTPDRSLSLLGHRRDGRVNGRPLDPILQFDTQFFDYEYEALYVNESTGKSNWQGRLAYVAREHQNFSQRDYQQVVGDLSYTLEFTGKLKSRFSVTRNVGPFETANSSYSVTNGLNGLVSYQVSDKLQASVNLSASRRVFGGRGQFDTSGRQDNEQAIGLNLNWRPIRNVGLSFTSTYSSRNSTLSQFDFTDRLTAINVELRI